MYRLEYCLNIWGRFIIRNHYFTYMLDELCCLVSKNEHNDSSNLCHALKIPVININIDITSLLTNEMTTAERYKYPRASWVWSIDTILELRKTIP